MNKCAIVICAFLLFFNAFAQVQAKPKNPHNPNSDILDNSRYFEYPTETWIIESQDYFGSFLEWDFIPIDGQHGDKKNWNFIWKHLDYIEVYNETIGESISIILNPIFDLRKAWNKNTLQWDNTLQFKVYNETNTILKFKNWGDFKSDCSRLVQGDYPIVPEDNEFIGLKTKIDIFNFDNGSFLVTFKDKWKVGKKISIGFGSTITYSGPTNTITCTGGTEGSEIDFWDFWNASYINGWNVTCQTCENITTGIGLQNTQYLFDCFIQIGDGSTETWFADEKVQVTFTDLVPDVPYIKIKNNANFRLGEVYDAATINTRYGCSLFFLENTNGRSIIHIDAYADSIELYSSQFISVNAFGQFFWSMDGIKIWNCLFDQAILYGTTNTDLQSSIIYNARYCLKQVSGTLQDIKCFGNDVYDAMQTPRGNLTNLITANTNRLASRPGLYESAFINCKPEEWEFSTWLGTEKVYRQYEFDLTITFPNATTIQNANVTLSYYGQGGGTTGSWLTNSTGQISTQTLTMGFYNQTGGDTIYDYNPYNLTITRSGRQTYSKNFTLSEKVNWTIALTSETVDYSGLAIIAFMLFIAILAIFVLMVNHKRD